MSEINKKLVIIIPAYNEEEKISEVIKKPIICALGRAVKNDIDKSWEAIQQANKPRLHTFVATSDLHMRYKLKKTPNEIKKLAWFGIEHAKGYCEDVEFSPEDASRTELSYLADVVSAAIEAGATTVNIPDTVGYTVPAEFDKLFRYLNDNVPGIVEAAQTSLLGSPLTPGFYLRTGAFLRFVDLI